MTIIEFATGIFSSMIGTLVLIAALPIFSKKFKKTLIWVFGKLSGFEIEAVFQNRRDAEADIILEMGKSRTIKIFTTRGNEIRSAGFSHVFKSKSKSSVKVILPQHRDNFFLEMRESELVELSQNDDNSTSMFYKGSLIADTENNASYFKNSDSSAELTTAVVPLIGRIIVLEHTCFFTIYRDDKEGSNCKTLKYARGTDMYHFLDRYFEHSWESAQNQNRSEN